MMVSPPTHTPISWKANEFDLKWRANLGHEKITLMLMQGGLVRASACQAIGNLRYATVTSTLDILAGEISALVEFAATLEEKLGLESDLDMIEVP
jgi:hypothetical protein